MQYTTTSNIATVQSEYPTQWPTTLTASACRDAPPPLPVSYRASSIANKAG